MNIEEDESAICLYIDELKSDDQSLKINAVDKISIICNNLSQERIHEEFFPYLQYIIQECDNEDEFLIKLSENLINFLQTNQHTLQSTNIFQSSLRVFEPLVVMEDSRVRQSALNGFEFLSQFLIDDICDLIIKLGTSDIVYAKIFCTRLIAIIIQQQALNKETYLNCSKIIILLVDDRNLQVKRSALLALEFLWKSPMQDQLSEQDMEVSVKSESFVGKLADLIKDIKDCGAIFELLKESFINQFFGLLNEDQKNEIRIVLLEKLIKSLDINLKQNQQQKLHNFGDHEINGVQDKEWKLKYMICNTLHLILPTSTSNSEFLISNLKKISEDFSIFNNDPSQSTSIPSKSPSQVDMIKTNYLKDNQTKEEELSNIISKIIYHLFRKYISLEMQEVRSAYFWSVIQYCKMMDDSKLQLIILTKIIDLVNEFILYEKSFYVKMKLNCFMEMLLDISQHNIELANTWAEFSSIHIKDGFDIYKLPIPTDTDKEEGENEINRINNLVVLNTEITKVEFNCKNLVAYSYNLFKILSIDKTPEIFKYKFIYLKKVLEMSSNSDTIREIFNKILNSLKYFHQEQNIKLKEICLQFVIYIIEQTSFHAQTSKCLYRE